MGRKSISEIRKAEIVEAFFEVVGRKGFLKATMREIAAVAGCSQGMLHHYFENKEAMVLAVMDYLTASYAAEIKHRIAGLDSASERLRFLFSWFFDAERFDPAFCRVWMEFWALSKTHPAISGALTKCYGTVKDALVSTIRDGAKAGEFRKVDAPWVARLILESLEGAILLAVVDGQSLSFAGTAKKRADFFMHYLT